MVVVDQSRPYPDSVQSLITRVQTAFDSLDLATSLTFFALGSVSTASLTLVYARYGRRIKNGDWVTPDVFAKKRWIRGVVTSVGDSDNFRLYHTPAFGWRLPFKFRRIPKTAKKLKDETLHIRLAGVDAPEAAHFGRPAQPYSAESLAWLRERILGRSLYCQLIRRDQYSRVVAHVVYPPWILPGAFASGRSLQMEMLKAGWGTTYEQAGAEYGTRGKEEFLRVEAEAKAARRGMWKGGVDIETPAQYKRRHAAASSSLPPSLDEESGKKGVDAAQGKSWFRRLFSR